MNMTMPDMNTEKMMITAGGRIRLAGIHSSPTPIACRRKSQH